MLRTSRTGLVLAGAIALSACGGGTTPTPIPSPTPTPLITETIVIYGDNGSFPPETVGYIPFSIPSAGTVEATVDWTFASSTVAIAMTTDACDDAEAVFLGQCSHIGTANISRTMKPKTVSGTVSQATSARLWILNLATVNESVAVQITLTRTRAASAPVVLEPSAWNWVPGTSAAVQAVRAFQDQN